MSHAPIDLDRYSLIGPGGLGEALASTLRRAGVPPDCVAASSLESAQDFVRQFGEGEAVTLDSHRLAGDGPLLLAVPDDRVEDVARLLAANGADWGGVVVLHTSGALDSSALSALADVGAHVGSFHPIQTFTPPVPEHAFRGVTVGIEGDDPAAAIGYRLADILCAEAVPLTPEQKILYHSAAVMAGNFAVTLLSVASEIWGEAVQSGVGFQRAMAPLIRTSIENALEKGPERALSGPIARGDLVTLTRELDAVESSVPHLLPVFASMAAETVHLATRSGTLSSEIAVRMLDLIHDRLKTDQEVG